MDEDTRTGAANVDEQGHVFQENNQCPGVHGEVQAANEVITVGCEDGALVYKEGKFTEHTNPENSYFAECNHTAEKHHKVQLPQGVSYSFRPHYPARHGSFFSWH